MIAERSSGSRSITKRGVFAVVTAMTLALGGTGIAAPAHADTRPAAGVPETVTAFALPTWQIDGVVWSQAIVGNSVFVGGQFNNARPPGAAVGAASSVPAANLFAYDIRTGNPLPNFSHQTNGQVRAVMASSDNSRIYVGGDFTAIDGHPRAHVAAFDATTGVLLDDFQPNVDGRVTAIAVSPTQIYIAGQFSKVNGTDRGFVAGLTSAGDVTGWRAYPNGYDVLSMVVTPDNSKVILGGRFSMLNGAYVYGQGAVSATTGALMPWAANTIIKDSVKGGITSLTTDGQYIYGTGYAFGAGGEFEGPFVANPDDGSLVWMADCHGDNYSIAANSTAVYSVGHAHECLPIGSFPDTNPRVRHQRAQAWTKNATTTNTGPDSYGWNYNGQPAPSMLHWYPNLQGGTFTGQGQAAWSVAANDQYVVMGGEFPAVNGNAQQGLTRMAMASVNSRTMPPRFQTVPARTITPPSAVTISPGTVRLTYQTAWDYDNEELKYELFRDYGQPTQTLVNTRLVKTNFWTVPDQTFVDKPSPGTYTYTVRVTDQTGNTLFTEPSLPVSTSDVQGTYPAKVITDGATSYWRLGEGSGTTIYDTVSTLDGTATATGVTRGAAGAVGDSNSATKFDGATGTTAYAPTGAAIAAPQAFSVETWFNTTTTTGGKLIGFGNSKTSSGTSDRHLYMDNSGRVYFGAFNTSAKAVAGANSYNDGNWHHAVGTMDPTTGLSLYIDGRLAARDQTVTSAKDYKGYWRLGGDNMSGWAGNPTSKYFNGALDEVAVYNAALTPEQVAAHWTTAGKALTPTPAPATAFGQRVLADNAVVYWPLNEASGRQARDYTGHDISGLYSTGGLTYQVPGPFADAPAMRFNGSSGSVGALTTVGTAQPWTAEAWVRTTSTRGGKVFGLGDLASGTSTRVDRSLSFNSTGTLRFSTGNTADYFIDSPLKYNDGKWHHVVTAQNETSMTLYVDGQPVAKRDLVFAPSFPGFWRLGFDRVISGASSNYLAGDISNFAAYDTVLTPTTVKDHYRSGGGSTTNQPPTVAINLVDSGMKIQADSVAGDVDGSIASYAWDFGDGNTATTASATHSYAAAGTYQVKLTVTDNEGATASATKSVTIANSAPVASFTQTTKGLGLSVDASASSDVDGTVESYSWDFGDGSTGTGATATHSYAAVGTYDVTLTVTDNLGATESRTQSVSIIDAAPTAAFTSSATAADASFDAAESKAPGGTIASYVWNFGDGSTGTGVAPTHKYTAEGTYSVTLTVTDDQGRTDTVTKPVTITIPNVAPTAALTASVDTLGSTVSVDGSASTDPDGSIASYKWNFGDGSTGTGASATHAYTTSGTYTVSLVVTDNKGATSTAATKDVTVNVPVLVDSFGRTTTNAWGTPEVGPIWSATGSASYFSVSGGQGKLRLNGPGSGLAVGSPVSTTRSELQVSLTSDKAPAGGSQFYYLIARGTSSDGYGAKLVAPVTGPMTISLNRWVAGAETTITSAPTGITFTPGTQYNVRVRAVGTGPTALQVKIWPTDQAEPTNWNLSATDSTASLQTAGGVALRGYLSGAATNAPVVLSFDNVVARAVS